MAGAGAMIGIMSVGGVVVSHQGGPRADAQPVSKPAVTTSPSPHPTAVSYPGQDGKTALAILKQRAVVVTQGSGSMAYVTSINGYRANEAKHEYWTVYINGEACEAAPATVATHSGDQVEWRIASY
jgi:hypothetical protein